MQRTPLSRNPISQTPAGEPVYEGRKPPETLLDDAIATNPSEARAIQAAGAAFDKDWEDRAEIIKNSPIQAFLKAHELAGSPNELTITGVADVRVTLGDLRAFVRAVE